MARPAISAALRDEVVKRAKGLCEYCQTQQAIVISLEVDHIIPYIEGGATTLDNLCLACNGCNLYKSAHQTGIDPVTNDVVTLFNPRQDQWEQHFQWDESKTHLIGLTATGRATIDRLQINRPEVVKSRELWVLAGWYPPKL